MQKPPTMMWLRSWLRVLGSEMEWGTIILASLPIIILLLYWHFTRTFSHWRKKGVFYIEPQIFFGNVKDRFTFRCSFHEMQLRLYKQFEGHPYAGYFEGRRPVLIVRDPDLIRNIMVRDFDCFVDRPVLRLKNRPHIDNMLINLKGAEWKKVRAMLTPTFSSGKLKSMEKIVVQCGNQMTRYLTEHVTDNNNEFEMKDLFGRFTMDVIATCAFGVQCDSLKDPNDEFVKTASEFNDISVLDRVIILAVLFIFPPLLKYLPVSFFNEKSIAFLAKVVQDTKDYRKNNESARRNDFLQLVLDAAAKENEDIKEQRIQESVMTDDKIVAQSVLFLLAGYETSSTLLSYASYELALSPDVQEKARNEVKNVLSKYGGVCTYEALNEMNYLENVLSEALRMHPPVARIDRMCTKPYTIPGTDVKIDVGDSVSIPVMGLHYDPQYYPDPYKFDPDRFVAEEKLKRPSHVYLPFGGGPRNCIGARFAIMSTKIGMAHLLKDFNLKRYERTDVPCQIDTKSMLLKSKNGIWLRLEKINAL
ncbi:probable cytochrome P450 6a13 isoform X1 [Schistocerca cancellata]|nr:probable cytochrome P450 6a13 isoform X1 [Schistocerca cancellata]